MDAKNSKKQLKTDQEIQRDVKLRESKLRQKKVIIYTAIIIAVLGIAYYYFLGLQDDYETVMPPKFHNHTVQIYDKDFLQSQDYELWHSGCKEIQYGFHVFPLHTVYSRPERMHHPIRCFAFLGSWGRLRITLRQKLHLNAVIVELKRRTFIGPRNKRAPETFVIYGFQNSANGTHTELGRDNFKMNGPSRQTFLFPDQNQTTAHEFVELRVFSKFGLQVFICVYRFRVHGNSC